MVDRDEEARRLRNIYEARHYDVDPAYCDVNPVNLQRVQSMERAALRALAQAGLSEHIGEIDVLDFGCGNGKWFGRWLAWGAMPERLVGVDARPEAITLARRRFPGSLLQPSDPDQLPFEDERFDVVSQNGAFSSILDAELRAICADELSRVLRPGGLLLWCDLAYDNPRNPDVKAVKARELRALFRHLEPVRIDRLVLAPPLARQVVPTSWLAARILEYGVPFLRTHLHAVLRKPTR